MAGGGLRLHNLLEVVRRTGVKYLHGSMNRWRKGNGMIESTEGNGSTEDGGHVAVSGPAMLEVDVRESVRLLRDEFTAKDFAARTALR
jgi:copper homeostasis protein CutC